MKRWFLMLVVTGAMLTQARAEGVLMPACPDSPNCVSSLAPEEDSHYVAPLNVPADMSETEMWMRLRTAIEETGGVITAQDSMRLDATYTTRFLRFVDDVTVIWNPVNRTLDIRSASRTGYYDFGANRRRVEAIRKAFLKPRGKPV
ncbi:DUF1499 domain-containing protein [Hahella sp. SMD15-11]|uniref:DUF1499 domain-containing protein n=1 Tax=Thermohahella caldifontis TaxID=3142973 RepID=A0AB39UWA6_9GAMM